MANSKVSKSLRCAMIIPMVLMIASVITGCICYNDAKVKINEDLNHALLSLVHEKSEILCQPDTVAAIRSMDKAIGLPICYRANDLNFTIPKIANYAYYTLRMADATNADYSHFIESDSILLYDKSLNLGAAIEMKGYVDCTMSTVFSVSDKSLPGALMTLSVLSMLSLWCYRQRNFSINASQSAIPDLTSVKLTPMQRQLVEMILSAPEHRVNKYDICIALWGNKSNAEESLYTLVKRTKSAIASTNMEIVCNRGDSYELRIKS